MCQCSMDAGVLTCISVIVISYVLSLKPIQHKETFELIVESYPKLQLVQG